MSLKTPLLFSQTKAQNAGHSVPSSKAGRIQILALLSPPALFPSKASRAPHSQFLSPPPTLLHQPFPIFSSPRGVASPSHLLPTLALSGTSLNITLLKRNKIKSIPDQYVSVGQAHKVKSHGFNSQSWYMLGLRVLSLVRVCMRHNQSIFLSYPCFSPSL